MEGEISSNCAPLPCCQTSSAFVSSPDRIIRHATRNLCRGEGSRPSRVRESSLGTSRTLGTRERRGRWVAARAKRGPWGRPRGEGGEAPPEKEDKVLVKKSKLDGADDIGANFDAAAAVTVATGTAAVVAGAVSSDARGAMGSAAAAADGTVSGFRERIAGSRQSHSSSRELSKLTAEVLAQGRREGVLQERAELRGHPDGGRDQGTSRARTRIRRGSPVHGAPLPRASPLPAPKTFRFILRHPDPAQSD